MFASLKINANYRMTIRLTQDSALSMFIVLYNVAQIAGKSKYNKAASACCTDWMFTLRLFYPLLLSEIQLEATNNPKYVVREGSSTTL